MASSVAPAPTRQQSVYGASASVDSLAVDSTVKLPYSPASSDEEFELQPPVAPFMGKNVKTMSGSLRPSPRTHNRARSSLSSVTSFQDSIFSTTSAETTLTLPDPAEVDLPVLARTGIIVVSFDAGGIKGVHHSEGIKALQVAVNTALAAIGRPPQPLSELVDLVLGTSVGALNAIAFAAGSADKVADMWTQIPTTIFKRGFFARALGSIKCFKRIRLASATRLRAGIVAALGRLNLAESDTMASLATPATPTVAIATTTCTEFGHPVYISSRPLRHNMRTHEHLRILDAATASASAPFYFKSQALQLDPASTLMTDCLDGAFGVANPAYPLDLNPRSIGVLISFGCTSGQVRGCGVAVPPKVTGANAHKYAGAFANSCTNSWVGAEQQRRSFRSAKRSDVYHRIPAPPCYDTVKLDERQQVSNLRKASEEMFAGAEWQEKLKVMATQIVQIRYGKDAKA